MICYIPEDRVLPRVLPPDVYPVLSTSLFVVLPYPPHHSPCLASRDYVWAAAICGTMQGPLVTVALARVLGAVRVAHVFLCVLQSAGRTAERGRTAGAHARRITARFMMYAFHVVPLQTSPGATRL